MSNIWMVLQQTAAASLVALFVLVLQKIFQDKLSPKWQYTIWGVLLCRLVIPVGWGSGSVLDASGLLDILRVWGERKLGSAWASPWRASLPGLSVPVLPSGLPRSVTDWLFVGYLLGVAVCGVWLFLGWLRLRKMVKSAVPVVGERMEEIKTISARLELKAPTRVVETMSAHGPFLMGVFRPTLVVPMGWQVDEKVLLHELLHRKNQDVLAGWITALFRCIHWCNPFLWWVFDRIDNQREERCDQQVLERLEGEERRDYGRVLLSMAEDQVIRVPGATSMANGAQRIKQRIQSIARFKTFPTGMGLVTVCMTLILIPYLGWGSPPRPPWRRRTSPSIPRNRYSLTPSAIPPPPWPGRCTAIPGGCITRCKAPWRLLWPGLWSRMEPICPNFWNNMKATGRVGEKGHPAMTKWTKPTAPALCSGD